MFVKLSPNSSDINEKLRLQFSSVGSNGGTSNQNFLKSIRLGKNAGVSPALRAKYSLAAQENKFTTQQDFYNSGSNFPKESKTQRHSFLNSRKHSHTIEGQRYQPPAMKNVFENRSST